MTAIETINYEGRTLAVLVQEQQPGKGYVQYYIDGIEVTDWGKIVTRYQRILSALADNLCETTGLAKWSY